MTARRGQRRLSTKLMWVAAVAFVVLVSATLLVIWLGFRNTLQAALDTSVQGLKAQVTGTVGQLVEQEARVYTERLEEANSLALTAAQLFASAVPQQRPVPLIQGRLGQWYNPDPQRTVETFLASGYDLTATQADQRDSAILELMLPRLLAQIEDAVAVYFVGSSALTRFYPVINLHETSAATVRVTEQAFFVKAAPQANPNREPRWSAPYEDTAGQGRLVTLAVPVYRGGVFRGVIGVDVSVDKLVARFAALRTKLRPTGDGFLIDAQGRVVAVSDALRPQLFPGSSADVFDKAVWEMAHPELKAITQSMAAGAQGVRVVNWDGQARLMAYAPITTVGWSLGIVLPYDEALRVVYDFADSIQRNSRDVLQVTLIATVLLFLGSLLAIAYLSRRFLTDPIAQLVQGTQALALGDLGTQVPVRSNDELGELAHSFNAMSSQLAHARDQGRELEQLQQSVSETKLLIEVANSVHFEDDLHTTLEKIAKAVVDNTHVVACVLMTTGEDQHPWSVQVSHGLPEAFIEAAEQTLAEGASMKMSTTVHQSRQRVVVADWPAYMRSDPAFHRMLPWTQQPRWTAVVCVPLLARTQMMGTAYFYFPPQHDLSEPTLNLYDAVANQIALTIENAQLLEQTRKAEREARTMTAVAAVVADPSSADSTLNRIAQRVVEVSGALACAVYVFEDGPPLRIAGAFGLPEGYNNAIEQAWREGARSAAIIAFEERQVIVRERLRDDTLANPTYQHLHPFLEHVPWQQAIFCPLLLGNRTLGTLVTYFPEALTIEQTTLRLYTAIADQVVVAVENARLFLQAQDKAGLEERQRLARELHDSVSQALFSIAMSARTAGTLLKRGQAEQALEPVEYTLTLAEAGIAEMRALIFELRPESLEQEGLRMALSKQAASMQARNQIQVKLELADEPELNLRTKEAVYRIAQEALHNIVKHAKASEVTIRLTTNHEQLELSIADDGRGFDPSLAKPGHLGLHSMRERAQGVGAMLEVQSEPNQGTTLLLTLPLKGQERPGAKG